MASFVKQNLFINEILEAHNKYRKLHNVPLLEHDLNLSKSARNWAEYLAFNDILQYKNQLVGENILRAKSNYLTGEYFN